MKIVKIKSKNKIGVLVTPSFTKYIGNLKYSTLNMVFLKNGTIIACRDDDLEFPDVKNPAE